MTGEVILRIPLAELAAVRGDGPPQLVDQGELVLADAACPAAGTLAPAVAVAVGGTHWVVGPSTRVLKAQPGSYVFSMAEPDLFYTVSLLGTARQGDVDVLEAVLDTVAAVR